MTSGKKFRLVIKKPNLKKFIPKKNPLKKFNKKKFFRITLLTLLILSACGFGVVMGVYKAILQNLPPIAELAEYEANIITYVYSDKGEVLEEYALEKRIEVTGDDIPPVLKEAIIATEDPRFHRHRGIDFFGILRALKEDVKYILTPKKLHGGSTITQQLARRLFLHPKQTLRRKFKEWVLALQIERNYTKDEILTMYCNLFDLGYPAYGVEAASQRYFDKSVSDLDLEESALIAGIFRGPTVYSPYRNPGGALSRRNHVLNRMADEKFITKEEAEEIKQRPLNVLPRFRSDAEFAAYFNEEVRKYLYNTHGKDRLYKEGLKVYTTLDTKLQRFAEESLREGLRELDKRLGWRKDKINLLEKGVENLEEIIKPLKDPDSDQTFLLSWRKPSLKEEDIIEAVVLSVERAKAEVKIKERTAALSNRGIAWTRTNNLKNVIKRGDIIHVKVKKVDEEKNELLISLDQEPVLEAAFVAIEPQTGQIKAMVGGYSFNRLQFNQVTQALRQSGSVVKPILYTAALENGYTPATGIIDEPTEFPDKWSDEPYAPGNYDRKYKGRVTLRMGLEQSRNIVTTKLLNFISPQTGVDYCRKFGVTSPVYPYLSLALGAFEIKLVELVSAFSTFPNKGVRINPYFITHVEDKDGNILEEVKIESYEVISPQVAYIMTHMMQGVVQRGTAQAAGYLEKPLGGKTGTTDDYSNAWFIGYSPSLCAGVWIGHPRETKTIGDRQSGAVAALPIWINFFTKIIEDEKKMAEETGEELEEEFFEVPPNLVPVYVDRKTGFLATPICLFPFKEYFIPGTEPDRDCTYLDHMRTYDYYDTLREKK